jgi:hypothetical protein
MTTPIAAARTRWETRFPTSTGLTLGTFWLLSLFGVYAEGGDCFAPDNECQVVWALQGVHAAVFFGLAVAVTILGGVAIVVGGWRVPTLLALLSVAALMLGLAPIVFGRDFVGRGSALEWLPNGLFVEAPALVALAVASTRQAIAYRRRTGDRTVT